MKGGLILISLSLILILSVAPISASLFSDFWNKITGKTTDSETVILTCTDSDGDGGVTPTDVSNWNSGTASSLHFTTAGTATSYSNGVATGTFTDHCNTEGGAIVESFCFDNMTAAERIFNCPDGTLCYSGDVCTTINSSALGNCTIVYPNSPTALYFTNFLTVSGCYNSCFPSGTSIPWDPNTVICTWTPTGSAGQKLDYKGVGVTQIVPGTNTQVTSGSSSGGGSGGTTTSSGGSSSSTTSSSSSVAIDSSDSENPKTNFNINQQDSTVTGSNGVVARSKVEISTTEGKVYATKKDGVKEEIKVDPTTVVNLINESIKSGTFREIRIIEYQNKIIYEVDVTKPVKVFALISANMAIKAKVDVEEGNIISIERPWWDFLAKEN